MGSSTSKSSVIDCFSKAVQTQRDVSNQQQQNKPLITIQLPVGMANKYTIKYVVQEQDNTILYAAKINATSANCFIRAQRGGEKNEHELEVLQKVKTHSSFVQVRLLLLTNKTANKLKFSLLVNRQFYVHGT